jgi:hypothetical protein
MRKSSILMLTAVAALGSSFLVPADAFASHRGFAHAAQVGRSHASTGGVHTASFGFRRSNGFQRPVSSGTVASGSFTQRRFGSANTAVGRPPSIASRFSMGNRTFDHTPQLNTLASNSHALTGPQAANGHAEKNTQSLTNAQLFDLTKRASADFGNAHFESDRARALENEAERARHEGPAGLHKAAEDERFAREDKADAVRLTRDGDKDLKTAESGVANKGSSNTPPSGGAGNGTGGKGGGTGGDTGTGGGTGGQ